MVTLVAPIKPSELAKTKASKIPNEVIQIVNNLLVSKYSGGSKQVIIFTHEVRSAWNNEDTWQNSFLDFEPIFEEAGYKVKYEKPSYGDSYASHFVFKWE